MVSSSRAAASWHVVLRSAICETRGATARRLLAGKCFGAGLLPAATDCSGACGCWAAEPLQGREMREDAAEPAEGQLGAAGG